MNILRLSCWIFSGDLCGTWAAVMAFSIAWNYSAFQGPCVTAGLTRLFHIMPDIWSLFWSCSQLSWVRNEIINIFTRLYHSTIRDPCLENNSSFIFRRIWWTIAARPVIKCFLIKSIIMMFLCCWFHSRYPECSESFLCSADRTQGSVPLDQLPETRGGLSSFRSPHVSSQIQVCKGKCIKTVI